MKRILTAPLAASLMLLAACVTINVYFPAVAAEKAADRFIEDVWGPQATPMPEENQPQETSPPGATLEQEGAITMLAGRTLDFFVPVAHAQQPDFNISTPAIQAIKQRMEQRHSELAPHYESGAVGLTDDALVTIRDQAAIPLPQRNQVKQLVADENADRNALYREIAAANNRPEWEGNIRSTFAQRWIANARAGWWYQNANGDWVQK